MPSSKEEEGAGFQDIFKKDEKSVPDDSDDGNLVQPERD